MDLTTAIPDRQPDEDEVVIVIALRRQDPGNPEGDAAPDLPDLNEPGNTLAQNVIAVANAAGFDPERSYVTIASLTDTEQGGAITLAGLTQLQNPEPEPTPEPEPEPAPEG